MSRGPSGGAALGAVLLAAVAGLWTGAEYLAWRLDFHPYLGRPVAEVAGLPIYSPLHYLLWTRAYGGIPALAGVLTESRAAVGAGMLLVGLPLVLLLRRRGRAEVGDSHGSARWGDPRTLFSDPEGLIVGREGRRLLRYAARGEPVLTFAPTGAGKGVSVAIPNLLDYPGSVLAMDPKGELAAVTARRRREMGQRVHVLDPWGLVGGRAAYNPLDLVDVGNDDAVDDARLLARMLVGERGGEEGAYWDAEAREVVTALILHVATTAPAERRHLPFVRDLLTLPPEEFEALLAEMRDDLGGGVVARVAAGLQDRSARSPKEYLGVLNTARSHTHFLGSPRMARVLGRSTFDPEELKRGRTSVYLVLPAERLDTYAAWMRLVIASTLTSLSRARGVPGPPALVLLDEVGQLGRVEPIERAVSLARGYGVQLWLLFQSLAQVEASYGRPGRAFLANAGLVQVFGVADPDTAEYFSRMTGEATVRVESENESRGVSGNGTLLPSHVQRGRAVTVSAQGRRLLTPDEVRRLPRGEQLLFVRGEAPVHCRTVDYRSVPAFRDEFDPNPMHEPTGPGPADRARLRQRRLHLPVRQGPR